MLSVSHAFSVLPCLSTTGSFMVAAFGNKSTMCWLPSETNPEAIVLGGVQNLIGNTYFQKITSSVQTFYFQINNSTFDFFF